MLGPTAVSPVLRLRPQPTQTGPITFASLLTDASRSTHAREVCPECACPDSIARTRPTVASGRRQLATSSCRNAAISSSLVRS